MQPLLSKETTIPTDVEQGLNEFCTSLSVACGPQLISVLLYGSVAKGEYVRGKSDVNVLLMLTESSLDGLDRLRPVIAQAQLNLPLSVMVLTKADLDDAADVFSVKFLDIQRHHRVLFGPDVAPDLNVTTERLRRQCSRELMNLQLRLRQFYLQRALRPELIEKTLTQMLSPFLTILGVLLELKTGIAPPTKAAAASAADQLGLDRPLLEKLLGLKRGDLKPDAASLKTLYAGFMQTVQQATGLVNRP